MSVLLAKSSMNGQLGVHDGPTAFTQWLWRKLGYNHKPLFFFLGGEVAYFQTAPREKSGFSGFCTLLKELFGSMSSIIIAIGIQSPLVFQYSQCLDKAMPVDG
jgi:hypothetical protein